MTRSGEGVIDVFARSRGKSLLLISLALVMIQASVAAADSVRPKRERRQVVEGVVHLATGEPATNTCTAGIHRRLMLAAGPGAPVINGMAGFHFDVSANTYGKRFVLRTDPSADLDIWFSNGWGDIVEGPPYTAAQQRKGGLEVGKVPVGMNKAVVCMFSGAAAEFRYVAG